MTGSRATITWVVSGALGVATFTAGMLVSQGGGDAAPAQSRPAVRVTPGTAAPTAAASPTATPAQPSATATASTGPSPVTPPSAETPD